MKIPSRYCPECAKEGLEKLDLAEDDRNTIRRLKQAIPVAGVLGGRDAALAEVCFLLDLPVPEDMTRQPLDKNAARILLDEMARRFGHWVMDVLMNSRMGEEYLHYYMARRKQEEQWRDEMRRSAAMRMPIMVADPGTPVEPREKHYYVPEYRVKENKR